MRMGMVHTAATAAAVATTVGVATAVSKRRCESALRRRGIVCERVVVDAVAVAVVVAIAIREGEGEWERRR